VHKFSVTDSGEFWYEDDMHSKFYEDTPISRSSYLDIQTLALLAKSAAHKTNYNHHHS